MFLSVFINLFYFDDESILERIFFFYLAGVLLFILFFAVGIQNLLQEKIPYSGDWLAFLFIIAYWIYAWALVRDNPVLRKKYRTSMIISLATPMIILPIFKYFLLVPMPTEGLVVAFLDKLWYLDF